MNFRLTVDNLEQPADDFTEGCFIPAEEEGSRTSCEFLMKTRDETYKGKELKRRLQYEKNVMTIMVRRLPPCL